MLQKKEAIHEMNKYGTQKVPFFFMINYDQTQTYISIDYQQDVLFIIDQKSNFQAKFTAKKDFTFSKIPISFAEYLQSFSIIQKNILLGNSYLVNLTHPTTIFTNLSLRDIFDQSQSKYRVLNKNKWVCFSPETFVKIDKGKISTYPMKGTINSKIKNAREIILADTKETAEHATIVDLLRNDLSMVANNISVEKYRYIDEIKTNEGAILQVSSKIVGDLEPDYSSKIGSIIFDLLPAGSICGAPKKKTLEIIKIAEDYDRGFYTGIAGYFDGENLDSCVLIRFIEKKNNQLIFKSGGGITSQSKPENEYSELIQKVYVPFH